MHQTDNTTHTSDGKKAWKKANLKIHDVHLGVLSEQCQILVDSPSQLTDSISEAIEEKFDTGTIYLNTNDFK